MKSEPFLEPTHYVQENDGLTRYWSVRMYLKQGIDLEEQDNWIVEQIWGQKHKPLQQRVVLNFDNELKARQTFDELVDSKKQEGFRPIFK